MMKTVLVTGGFDPIHAGHVDYLMAARSLGDRLVVGINSNSWLERKKGRFFMDWEDRASIIEAFWCVSQVIEFDDSDGSACDAIRKTIAANPNSEIIFANGGDRTSENIPEMAVSHPKLKFSFGVGGENKRNSSSDLLKRWKIDRTERQWGVFDVLREYPGCKVKELIVKPGKSTSLQRHFKRGELWFVRSGEGFAVCGEYRRKLVPGAYIAIPVGEWHQIQNPGSDHLCIVEVQFGADCVEDDIERR